MEAKPIIQLTKGIRGYDFEPECIPFYDSSTRLQN